MKLLIGYLLLITVFSNNVLAWSQEGHFLVAQIAYDQLSNQTLQKIQDDLEGFRSFYPKYSDLLTSSVWPDMIRFRGIETFTTWHYIDIPYNPDNITLPDNIVNGTNVRWALQQSLDFLKSKKDVWGRNFYLRFLLHLAGDVHQPFHNAEYFSNDYPNGDEGGNRVKIWNNYRYTNLHKFWDSAGGLFTKKFHYPLTNNETEYIKEKAQELVKKYPICPKYDFNFNEWSDESNKIATEFAYPDALENRNLTSDYIVTTRKISEEQIVKAGHRLAYLLNDIYGEETYNTSNTCYPWDYCYSPLDFIY